MSLNSTSTVIAFSFASVISRVYKLPFNHVELSPVFANDIAIVSIVYFFWGKTCILSMIVSSS